MEHLGDITAIDGRAAPPVDVVIGGSPCQDLSIAGKRQGLSGARSGLFMEQIRIIKEMRQADAGRGNRGRFIRPRYMVWENVAGALSSNKGDDFRAVLEETARIADPATVIPEPPKGKWATSGCLVGDGWSIAYRVLDAQFWGVPQRRRRVALVADFGGQSAPEVLFIRKSVCGDIEPAPAPGAGGGAGTPGGALAAGFKPFAGAGAGSIGYQPEQAPTLTVGQECAVYAVDCRNGAEDPCVNGTLQAKSTGGQSLNLNNVVRRASTVRRLTELECERLQGFPDGWTDIGPWADSNGRKHKGCTANARYMALGNSIAIPPWAWVLKRLCACYERPATMASLFDGIGGFPLIWERLNGPGACLWASEINEFAMAVTRKRLGEGAALWP